MVWVVPMARAMFDRVGRGWLTLIPAGPRTQCAPAPPVAGGFYGYRRD
jgi:hypothetical protein